MVEAQTPPARLQRCLPTPDAQPCQGATSVSTTDRSRPMHSPCWTRGATPVGTTDRPRQGKKRGLREAIRDVRQRLWSLRFWRHQHGMQRNHATLEHVSVHVSVHAAHEALAHDGANYADKPRRVMGGFEPQELRAQMTLSTQSRLGCV
jgi:hypothetical protein